MKKLLAIIVLGLLWGGNSYAETNTDKINKYVSNNLSYEYIECLQFYQILYEALKNDTSEDHLKNLKAGADRASEAAFFHGMEAGMSNDGMMARVKQINKQMLKSMDNNFANISVLNLEYGEKCKYMILNPENRNNYWLKKGMKKYIK